VNEQHRAELQESETRDDPCAGVTFRPDYQTTVPAVYANVAFVNHTADDFSIDFCLIAPPSRVEPATHTVPVPVVARVIVPLQVARGLIEALRRQLAKQTSERHAGQISIPVQGGTRSC
jgi:hypothetical protein